MYVPQLDAEVVQLDVHAEVVGVGSAVVPSDVGVGSAVVDDLADGLIFEEFPREFNHWVIPGFALHVEEEALFGRRELDEGGLALPPEAHALAVEGEERVARERLAATPQITAVLELSCHHPHRRRCAAAQALQTAPLLLAVSCSGARVGCGQARAPVRRLMYWGFACEGNRFLSRTKGGGRGDQGRGSCGERR